MTFAERGSRFDETPERRARRIAERQHALVRHDQALGAGISEAAIARRVESGLWQPVLPRVYRITGASRTGRQAAMAATLWAGDESVVSHRAAGVLWGLDAVETTRVEVTVPYTKAPRHRAVAVHRTRSLEAVDRDLIHGIPVTSPARTVVDLASALRGEALVAAVESALRLRLTTHAFIEWRLRALGGKGRKGSAELRRLLDERGRTAAALEYRLEVKLGRLLAASDLPRPVRQHWVEVDGKRFRLDFAWPGRGVAIEADGWDHHGGRVAFVRDHQRLSALAAAGWRVLPVTWEQVTRAPATVVAQVERALRTFH
jgi:very-short-patch-repair endonuclease